MLFLPHIFDCLGIRNARGFLSGLAWRTVFTDGRWSGSMGFNCYGDSGRESGVRHLLEPLKAWRVGIIWYLVVLFGPASDDDYLHNPVWHDQK